MSKIFRNEFRRKTETSKTYQKLLTRIYGRSFTDFAENIFNFENNKTKPDFSQIEEISKILETSILEFLTDNSFQFNTHINEGGNNGFVINNVSEKLIEQYELRIKKLEEETKYLKNLLDKFVK